MADLYNSFSSAGDPGGGRDASKFYAFDAKSHADAINTNTHAQTQTGLRSALPAAGSGNTGAVYKCTDCDAEYKSDGSAWTKIRVAGVGSALIAEPPTTGWTAVNMQTGWTFASDLDGLLFTAPTTVSQAVGYQYRTYPGSAFTLTVHMDLQLQKFPQVVNSTSYAMPGIVISDGTKLITYGPLWGNVSPGGVWNGPGAYIGAWRYNTTTSFSVASAQHQLYAVSTTLGAAIPVLPRWFQFIDDGTNRKLRFSMNGLDWSPDYLSESRTAFLTPTRIGLSFDNYSGSTATARVRSWSGVS